jgi:hypothetical protein
VCNSSREIWSREDSDVPQLARHLHEKGCKCAVCTKDSKGKRSGCTITRGIYTKQEETRKHAYLDCCSSLNSDTKSSFEGCRPRCAEDGQAVGLTTSAVMYELALTNGEQR